MGVLGDAINPKLLLMQGGHGWLSSEFFPKMTSRRKKRNSKNLHKWVLFANLFQINTHPKSRGSWNFVWWDSYGKFWKKWGVVWSFLSKNFLIFCHFPRFFLVFFDQIFLRFHWRDSLAHRWKRLRTRQGTWGGPGFGGCTEIEGRRQSTIPRDPMFDSQVFTYQFLRFCLWHFFHAFWWWITRWIYLTVTELFWWFHEWWAQFWSKVMITKQFWMKLHDLSWKTMKTHFITWLNKPMIIVSIQINSQQNPWNGSFVRGHYITNPSNAP